MTRTTPDTARPRTGRLPALLVGVSAAVGVVAAVVMSVLTAGGGAVVVLPYALGPATLLVVGYGWLGRRDPLPRRYLVAAFVWGAVVSTALAAAVQLFAVSVLGVDARVLAAVVAPLTEEPAKGAFLLVVLLRARRVVRGPVDALVLVGLAGTGFACLENVRYLAAAWADGMPGASWPWPSGDGLVGATAALVQRGVLTPWLHPLCTSVLAIAVASTLGGSRQRRLLAAGAGLGGSVLLHGLWNGTASYGGRGEIVAVYVVLVAALGLLVTFAVRARRRVGDDPTLTATGPRT